MDPAAALKAFAAVFPAELPDKTMIATIVLVTRYQRPLPVWCGAAAAFAIHVTVAVAAGGLLTLLPETAVAVATAVLFAAGAVVLWRSARSGGDDLEEEIEEELEELEGADEGAAGGKAARRGSATAVLPSARAAVVGSFGVIVVAEWGDLTQFATAGMAASTGEPVMVAVGALLALWSVAGIAASVGRQLAARLPIHRIQQAAAGVFALLAVSVLWSLRP
ncbi:MAG TPA: TMEM165/GDT1 family protein [Acidimicrobiales bacterium]